MTSRARLCTVRPVTTRCDRTAEWLRGPARFTTTRWSLVLEAGAAGDERTRAVEEFCRVYWYPVYAFVRRRGHEPEVARDLTQDFFAMLLEGGWLDGMERGTGRFSTRLCATLKNFLVDAHRRATAQKRGGGRPVLSLDVAQAEAWYGAEPATGDTPERLLERRWAQAVMEAALRRVEADCADAGKGRQFAELHPFLSRQPAGGEYEAAGDRLGVSATAVATLVLRLRRRYAEAVREEVAAGLRDRSQVDEELRHLAAAL